MFQGAADSQASEFGGHIILRKGKKIQITGAEVTRMGQKGLIGRYPFLIIIILLFFDIVKLSNTFPFHPRCCRIGLFCQTIINSS